MNKKVNLFIIGVNKAGSSWLYYLLQSHPDVAMSEIKELYYFGQKYPDGLKDYHRNFNFSEEKIYFGEATPTYYRDPGAAEQIKQYNPGAKILTIVRDPVDRCLSQFYYHKQLALLNESTGLSEAIIEEPVLLADSHYENYLPKFKKLFGPENFLILSLEDFTLRPEVVWKNVCEFLGIKTISLPSGKMGSENATGSPAFRLIYKLTVRPVKKIAPGIYRIMLKSNFIRHCKLILIKLLGKNVKEELTSEMEIYLRKEFDATYVYLHEEGFAGIYSGKRHK